MNTTNGSKPRDIDERTFAFALRIVRLCTLLDKKGGVGRKLGNQLLRAGTSIGANVEEGRAAQSRADFIHKNAIALKETRETRYWLRLLQGSAIIKPKLLAGLISETEELAKILGAIVCRTRRSKE
jgi:four helix bundle protein